MPKANPHGVPGLSKRPDGRWRWRRKKNGVEGERYLGTNKRRAIKAAVKLNEDFELQVLGLDPPPDLNLQVRPLVDGFVEELRRQRHEDGVPYSEKHVGQVGRDLAEVLELLRVYTARDLQNVTALDRRLRSSPGSDAKRRALQDVTKRFTRWLAGNRRHLGSDPLACWEPLPRGSKAGSVPMALTPEELARLFVAQGVLEQAAGSKRSQRVPLTVLLVTAPRIGAFESRTVSDFLPSESRIDYGAGIGKKRKGAGALDPRTQAELAHYVGRRKRGPLFLSPTGAAWEQANQRKALRAAHALGAVWQLWPSEEVDWILARKVAAYLDRGKLRVSKGGAPGRKQDGTLKAEAELAGRIRGRAEEIRERWERLVTKADGRRWGFHEFRDTFNTWIKQRPEVSPLAAERQGGWAATTGERTTASIFYTDRLRDDVARPGLAAETVREMLDQALEWVRRQPGFPGVPLPGDGVPR